MPPISGDLPELIDNQCSLCMNFATITQNFAVAGDIDRASCVRSGSVSVVSC